MSLKRSANNEQKFVPHLWASPGNDAERHQYPTGRTQMTSRTKTCMTEQEAGAYLSLAAGTLRNWRKDGVGPAFIKLGRSVRYTTDDLDRYVIDHTFEPEEHDSEKVRMK